MLRCTRCRIASEAILENPKSTLKVVLEVEVEGVWPNLCYGNVESSATRWQVLVALHAIITVTQHRGGIVQILIQGSIFIDGNATMQKYIRVAAAVQQALESAVSVSRYPSILSGRCLWPVADPSSSGNSLSGWEWENGKMGGGGGPWGLFPPCATAVAKARNVSIIYLGRAPPAFLLIDWQNDVVLKVVIISAVLRYRTVLKVLLVNLLTLPK